MRDLLSLFDNGGLSLDQPGQDAVMDLLTIAFTSKPGSVLDALSSAVEAQS